MLLEGMSQYTNHAIAAITTRNDVRNPESGIGTYFDPNINPTIKPPAPKSPTILRQLGVFALTFVATALLISSHNFRSRKIPSIRNFASGGRDSLEK
jgi:hypothetical protein